MAYEFVQLLLKPFYRRFLPHSLVLQLQVRRSSSVRAYYELMKPRIVYLLDFTAVMAFLVAASNINVVRLVVVVVAGTLASGGAGALNCYIDRDVDRTMGRTSWRPIPQGEISPVRALFFGLGLIGIGAVISALFLPLLGASYEGCWRLFEGGNTHAARCGRGEEDGAVYCPQHLLTCSSISSFCSSLLGRIWNYLSSDCWSTGSRHDSSRPQT